MNRGGVFILNVCLEGRLLNT